MQCRLHPCHQTAANWAESGLLPAAEQEREMCAFEQFLRASSATAIRMYRKHVRQSDRFITDQVNIFVLAVKPNSFYHVTGTA